METVGQRIYRLRKTHKISQRRLGEICGVSDVSVSNWEADKAEPSGKALLRVSKFFSVSATYLLYGKEQTNTAPIASSTIKSIPLLSLIQAGSITEDEIKNNLYHADNWTETAIKSSEYSFALRMRGDSMYNPNGLPTIPEGAIIIVDPSATPEHGKIVVAQLDGANEATIKKLVIDGPYKFLAPLNPSWDKIPIADNCSIIGVVQGVQYDL